MLKMVISSAKKPKKNLPLYSYDVIGNKLFSWHKNIPEHVCRQIPIVRTQLDDSVILNCLQNVLSISNSNSPENHAEILWTLSDLAVQSQGRQNSLYPPYTPKLKFPSYSKFHRPQKYYNQYYQNYKFPQKYLQGEYFPNEIPQDYAYYSQNYPFYFQKYPYKSQNKHPKPTKESIMDVLFSIAQNDDLQCVPKLVCELTSETMSGRQLGSTINAETLLGIVKTFNSAQSSPILHFGKAAFLGFTSKGNSRSCSSAYPNCPSDSTNLLKYLNNHKGGFFRFFQDAVPQQATYAQYFDKYYYRKNQPEAEKRIITHIPTGGLNNGLFFDGDDPIYPSTNNYDDFNKIKFENSYRDSRKLTFPHESYVPSRIPKKLRDSVSFDNPEDNNLDIQTPLPNHVPNPMIFPDRTGTGELKLDYDDFLSTETKDYVNFPKN